MSNHYNLLALMYRQKIKEEERARTDRIREGVGDTCRVGGCY